MHDKLIIKAKKKKVLDSQVLFAKTDEAGRFFFFFLFPPKTNEATFFFTKSFLSSYTS